jgi:hypothetical protein
LTTISFAECILSTNYISISLAHDFAEEESESEGEADEGSKLTKTREDIKRSCFKVLRVGKTKDGIPDEVFNFCVCLSNGNFKTQVGSASGLEDRQEE